jgi:hypothetical protein
MPADHESCQSSRIRRAACQLMSAQDLEALSRRVVPDSRCTKPPPPIPAEFFLWTELAQHGYESCAASAPGAVLSGQS